MKKLAWGVLVALASIFNDCVALDEAVLKETCDSNMFCIHFLFQGFPESSTATDDVLTMTGGESEWESMLQESTGGPLIKTLGPNITHRTEWPIHGKIKNGDRYVALFNISPTSCSSIIPTQCGDFSYRPYYVFINYVIKTINGAPVSGDRMLSYGKVSAASGPPQEKIVTITRQPDNTYDCQVN